MEKEKKLAILGFGREGQAVFKFIKKDKEFKDFDVFILDKNKNIKIPKNTKNRLGEDYLKNLNQFDIVIRSPGIPYNLQEIQKAVSKRVIFKSATSLFFEKAKGQIIGITGTKGKGTTSTLLYKILKNCGHDVYLAGNIGKPAIEILKNLKKKSISILELSSFQLQDLKVSPSIALILNIFPDHQDSHKNLEEYFKSKLNVGKFQKSGDKLFFIENSFVQKTTKLGRGKKIPIKVDRSNSFFTDVEKNIKIPGRHNLKNAIAAATLASFLKCPKYVIIKTIQNFKGLEHRLEFVKKIKNIRFYNDSASTNPQTTIAAIKAFREPKILIAGGKDKNLDYTDWPKAIKENNVKTVVLFGENKEKIKETLENKKLTIEVKLCSDLEESIESAYNIASKEKSSEVLIIFSPGSASFDMFKDYAERGRAFKKLVNMIK